MTTERAFRLLNVFTVEGDAFSGNQLCVFEDGKGLSDRTMQALARQFNLSETTFVLPPTEAGATARVRIFTPAFEMPFAGHPTLGTAHVVRSVTRSGDRVALEMRAGIVEVTARGDAWTLRTAYPPKTRAPSASRAELEAMLRLPAGAVAERPLWVDAGSEQLVVPLTSPAYVAAARPDADLLARCAARSEGDEAMAYVWARCPDGHVEARFFFVAGAVLEDPATGSACANLGGWLLATGAALPATVVVHQGEAVGRPSRLTLTVDAQKRVFVGGGVLEIGRGVVAV